MVRFLNLWFAANSCANIISESVPLVDYGESEPDLSGC